MDKWVSWVLVKIIGLGWIWVISTLLNGFKWILNFKRLTHLIFIQTHPFDTPAIK